MPLAEPVWVTLDMVTNDTETGEVSVELDGLKASNSY